MLDPARMPADAAKIAMCRASSASPALRRERCSVPEYSTGSLIDGTAIGKVRQAAIPPEAARPPRLHWCVLEYALPSPERWSLRAAPHQSPVAELMYLRKGANVTRQLVPLDHEGEGAWRRPIVRRCAGRRQALLHPRLTAARRPAKLRPLSAPSAGSQQWVPCRMLRFSGFA